jgi:hypothetical protein
LVGLFGRAALMCRQPRQQIPQINADLFSSQFEDCFNTLFTRYRRAAAPSTRLCALTSCIMLGRIWGNQEICGFVFLERNPFPNPVPLAIRGVVRSDAQPLRFSSESAGWLFRYHLSDRAIQTRPQAPEDLRVVCCRSRACTRSLAGGNIGSV